MMEAFKTLVHPTNEDHIRNILRGLWIILAISLSIGVVVETFFSTTGAFQASGGIAVALTVLWSAGVISAVHDVNISAKIQRHSDMVWRSVVAKWDHSSTDEISRDAVRRNLDFLDARISQKNAWVDETGVSLSKLCRTEGAIVFVGALVGSVGDIVMYFASY